jgi:diaminopimelate decarboxylase/aspartate kinase
MSLHVHGSLISDGTAVETPYANSPWVVMKFGGTSVADAANWASIERLLRERVADGERPFVCLSALAGVSNALIEMIEAATRGDDIETYLSAIERQHADLAAALGVDVAVLDETFATLRKLIVGVQLVGEAGLRVHARIMSIGEIASTTLGAAWLRKQGLDVEWRAATSMLRSLSERDKSDRANFLAARCDFAADGQLQQSLEKTPGIVLTQGFVAANDAGDTVLLGRGGSDTSAAYFAVKLQARRLEIWTDVPGFFSADPRSVPTARLIRRLHYTEAQEIASAGGGILHPRSISPVRRSGIPLFLKATQHPEWDGSVISNASDDDGPQLKAVSHRKRITLIAMESFDMWHQVGFLAAAFDAFRRHGISVDLISTSESNVTVTIDRTANVASAESLDALREDLSQLCRVTLIDDCAAVTLVGRRIRASLHELAPAFEAFEEHRVHLVTQAANDLNLTVVVDVEHAHKLVQNLHGRLIGRLRGGVFGPTWTQFTAATEPAEQAMLPGRWWRDRRDELLDIAKQHDCAYVYDRATVRHSAENLTAMQSVDRIFFAMKANSNPDVLREVHDAGVNFECVSPGEVALVREHFPDLDPERILFTPNFAARREYEWAVAERFFLTLDSLYPLQAWPELFRDREILVRIDPGKGRGHHEHVRTAGVQSKFGVPMFELDELQDCVAAAGARVVGLHAHVGSGVLNPDAWRMTGEKLSELAGAFADLRYMDLGGGLGIPERPGESALDLEQVDAGIATVRQALSGIEIWLEPGRYLCAPAGVLLAHVTQKKGKGDFQYLGITTGMNSLIRPALYGAWHEIVNLTRLDASATELTTIVGPICESADQLGSDRLMPRAEEGDVLLIDNVGAYGRVMSSRYNLREPATEISI